MNLVELRSLQDCFLCVICLHFWDSKSSRSQVQKEKKRNRKLNKFNLLLFALKNSFINSLSLCFLVCNSCIQRRSRLLIFECKVKK